MRLLLIMIGIVAGSILGVLVDWLLKGLSNVKPTPRNISAIIVACAVLAFFTGWSELLAKDSDPTQIPTQRAQPTLLPPTSVSQLTATDIPDITLQKVQQYEVSGNKGTEMVFSPDGNTLFVNDGDVIKAWEVETGIKIREYKSAIDGENYINKISISTDGSKLVGGIGNGSFSIWDIATGNLIRNIESDEVSSYSGYRAFDVDISQNGKTIVGSTTYDFGIWNVNNGEKTLDLDMSEWVMAIKFLPNSNDKFIVGLWEGSIALMDTNGGKLKFYEGATSISDNNLLAISENGDMIAAPVPVNRTSIRVWDTDSTIAIYTLESSDNTSIESVTFTSNDLLFAGSGFGNMWIWDAKNGNLLYVDKIDVSVLEIAIRPKRNQIVTISENHIVLWNVTNLDLHN